MGGEITVESEYGVGSVFAITLPHIETNRTAEDATVEVTNFTAPNAKILVVDDIETNLVVAEVMLDIFEIEPTLAHSGKEAIELAKTHDYHIIFMDHMMPEMDGMEAAGHIRQLGAHNENTAIIALTANAIKGTRELFLENDMDDVLLKPLEFEKLNLCLRKWLPAEIIEEENEHD